MPDYVYRPLEAGELRVMTLQPGNFDDELRASITHAFLSVRIAPSRKTQQVMDLQKTLPKRWKAVETVDSRILFYHRYNLPLFTSLKRTSWTHPDPKYHYVEAPPTPIPPKRLKYEALSYVWGDSEPAERLHITGVDVDPNAEQSNSSRSEGALSIQPNLASALRHLRDPLKPRVFWIDAVCINQNDISERSQQVVRMDSIFELAARVVIWLGPVSTDSPLALQTLELLGKQIERLGDSETVPAPNRTHMRWHTLLSCDPAALAAARSLLARPYFLRLWIWQEIILGSRNAVVQCGTNQIRWYHLRRAIILLRETNFPDVRMRIGLLADPLLYLPYWTSASARHKGSIDSNNGIMLALHGTSRAKCTDPRDRIYSLLGICEERLASKVKPNYELPPEQIYLDFSLIFLKECRSLSLLRFCDLSSRRIGSVTWVPDFTNLVNLPRMVTFAAGDTHAETNLLVDNVLIATGVQAGTVKVVSDLEMHGTPTSIADAFRTIKSWFSFGAQNIPPDNYVTAFFTVIFLGWVRDRWKDGGFGTKQFYAEFLRLSLPFKGRSIPNISWVLSIVWNYIAASMVYVLIRITSVTLQNRTSYKDPSDTELSCSILMHHFMRDDRTCSFFCTEEGHIGLGPIGIKPGDVISILLGCNRAIVLRPCSDDKFQVVGPTYIHGLNEAQGLLGPIPEPWEIKLDDSSGRTYSNRKTGKRTPDDPRMQALPADWSKLDDGKFRHNDSGQVRDQDPRWTTQGLERRGVTLRTFNLI